MNLLNGDEYISINPWISLASNEMLFNKILLEITQAIPNHLKDIDSTKDNDTSIIHSGSHTSF